MGTVLNIDLSMDFNGTGAESQSMQQFRMKQKHKELGKVEILDLGATDILLQSSECLNSDSGKKIEDIWKPNPADIFFTSDPGVDEQMLFKLRFRDPIDISYIAFRATVGPKDGSGPKKYSSVLWKRGH